MHRQPEVPIEQLLGELEHLLNQLADILSEERVALAERKSEHLARLAEQKRTVCDALNQARFTVTLPAAIAELTGAEREKCAERHSSAMAHAREIRDSNLVNGKIINRSQNTVRELMNILSGRRNALYDPKGQPANDGAGGPAIGQA